VGQDGAPPPCEEAWGSLNRPSAPLRIEVVNFLNPLRRSRGTLERDAIASATEQPELGLRVVTLPYLVALKLRAGGPGDYRDVAELLKVKQPLETEELKALCARHKLGGALDRILSEL